jgi:hypothetical protein
LLSSDSASTEKSYKDTKCWATGAFPEDPPCSSTGEHGQCEETSGGDFRGNGDPQGASGGVLALLGDELPSLEGERARLVPLLSSIVHKSRARKVNPKQARKIKCEMVISTR